MAKRSCNFIFHRVLCLLLVLATLLPMVPPMPAKAYMEGDYTLRGQSNIGINLMFDSLTANALQEYQNTLGSLTEAEKEWGKKGNPYVIDNDRHLQNLYILQNSGHIDPDSHFLVCNPDGTPVAVGSQNENSEAIEPVGNHAHPFTGTMEGAFKPGAAKLSTGETVSVSAIDGVVVESTGQVDIGFFGMVGKGARVENLVFSNVQIQASGSTEPVAGHTYYKDVKTDKPAETRRDPKETNHIGIIAGHVDHAEMRKLSVYYSSTGTNALALNSDANSNYLCGTGFFGLLDHLNPNDEGGGFNNDDFVSGGGSEGGGDESGLHPGYINAEAMFHMGQGGEDGIVEIIDLKRKDGTSLVINSEDEQPKPYIHDGVFSFALSGSGDTIQSIWSDTGTQTYANYFVGETVYTGPRPYDVHEAQQNGTQTDGNTATEQHTEIIFRKEPGDLQLSVYFYDAEGKKVPCLSIAETELSMADQGLDPASLDLSGVQALAEWDKADIYLLEPGEYGFTAEKEGYESVEDQSFTVDPRSDSMKIQITLLPAETEETAETTVETTVPAETEAPTETTVPTETEAPTETTVPAETEAPTETTVPTETEAPTETTVPTETTQPAETEAPTETTAAPETTAAAETTETTAPIQAAGLMRVPSRASALPSLYFGSILAAPLSDETTEGTTAATTTPTETTAPPETTAETTAPTETTAETTASTETTAETVQPGESIESSQPERLPILNGMAGLQEPRVQTKKYTLNMELLGGAVEQDILANHISVKFFLNGKEIPSMRSGGSVLQPQFDVEVASGKAVTYELRIQGYKPITGSIGQWDNNTVISKDALIKETGSSVKFICMPQELTFRFWPEGDTANVTTCGQNNRTLQLLPGKYYYKAAQDGYKPAPEDSFFEVTSGGNQTVTISLQPAGTAVTFQCVPQELQFTIFSESAEPILCTPENRQMRLLPGTYTYTASHVGFAPETKGQFTVLQQADQTIPIQLTPLQQVDVTLNCSSAAASLEVRDSSGNVCSLSQVSDTQFTGKLYAGRYTYTAVPATAGYGHANGEFELVQDPVEVSVLFAKPETVTFTDMPEGTVIQVWAAVDGTKIGEPIPVSGGSGQLVPGTYLYSAECAGYAPSGEIPFQVPEGGTQPISVKLLKLAVITFDCVPADTQITLVSQTDGTAWQPRADQKSVFELKPDTYLYTAEWKGYTPVKDQPLTVLEGEKKTVKVTLEKLPGAAITFVCQTQGMNLQVWAAKDGVPQGKPIPVTERPHTYVLETGEYVYSATKPNAKKLAQFENVPLKVESGADQQITLKLPALGNAKFVCEPQNLNFRFFYVMNGVRMPYKPAAPQNGVYRLPQGECIYEAGKTGYESSGEISIQVTAQQKTFKVSLTKGSYPIPSTGPYPPMDEIGAGKGLDQIRLTPVTPGRPRGDGWTWKSDVPTNGQYGIYLKKITSMDQVYSSPENVARARYFLCPEGYDGTGAEPAAYMKLNNAEAFSSAHFQAYRPMTALEALIQKKADVKPSPSYESLDFDIAMSFGSAGQRSQAMLDMGLQLEKLPNGKFNLYQTDAQSGARTYLGISAPGKNEDKQYGKRIIRSVDKQLTEYYQDPEIFDFTFQGSGNFALYTKNTEHTLSYRQEKSQNTDLGINYNDFTGGYSSVKFVLYQVVAYDLTGASFKGEWVPKDEASTIKLDANQYVLWRDPEYLAATGSAVHSVTSAPYTVIPTSELGNKGWVLQNGQPITDAYRPNKMFNIQYTTLAQDRWVANTGTVIRIPIRKGDKPTQLPIGTLSFYVNTMKDNPFVRVIVKIPSSVVHTDTINSRIGIWQVANEYWAEEPRAAVPLPTSQPQSPDTTKPAVNTVSILYNGQKYETYFQGESILLATAFDLKHINMRGSLNANGEPGGFFLTQSYKPLQMVYCAAEGIADGSDQPGPDPSKGKLDRIDFVYDIGNEVIPVTESRYVKSNQILQFENFQKDGSGYKPVYAGAAQVYREAMSVRPTPGGPQITHDLSPLMKMTELEKPSDKLVSGK